MPIAIEQRQSTARAIVESLVYHGVSCVFLVPGVQLDSLLIELAKASNSGRIRVVHARTEQGAALMAYGYAVASGRPAAFAAVPGPGFLNCAAALATAYATRAPVIALIGQVSSHGIGKGFGLLHEIPDQLEIMAKLTRWSARIDRPRNASRTITEALSKLSAKLPEAPVGIEISWDVLKAVEQTPSRECWDWLAKDQVESDEEIPEGLVRCAADAIARAHTPLIYLGGGATEAATEIRELAERLHCPIVAHRRGKGIVPDDHPLALNFLAARNHWTEFDLVLIVGSRFQLPAMCWGLRTDLTTIRIEANREELCRSFTPTIAMHADAKTALRALLDALPQSARTECQAGLVSDWNFSAASELRNSVRDQVEYLEAIRKALPRSGFLVDELTQVGHVARVAFPVFQARRFVTSGYQGHLGYGVATAIGVKVANPSCSVVSIAGDGGFLYASSEIATAVQHGIACTFVVFDDASFGNVRRANKSHGISADFATQLHNPDFVEFGKSFGVEALRVMSADELHGAVERAISSQKTTVIHVPVREMPDPWPLLMPERPIGANAQFPWAQIDSDL